MTLAEIVNDMLLAAGLPVAGVGGPLSSAGSYPGSTYYQRPEGWFRVDWASGTAPLSAQDTLASSTILGLDLSVGGQAALVTAQIVAQAQANLSDTTLPDHTLLRAVLLALGAVINGMRDRLTAQDAAVAAAVSLADFKTRWAALAAAAPMPDITAAQARAAVVAQIAAGNASS